MSGVIQLLREAVRDAHAAAHDAHPGLLLHRGLSVAPANHGEGNADKADNAKTQHIRRLCGVRDSAFYRNAYARWQRLTNDSARFQQLELQLVSRLFLGLNGGGLLETGCTLGHTHGMPSIPGSSVKGVVRAHVCQSSFGEQHPEIVNELFGVAARDDEAHPDGLSGLVAFHDAWWVPGSATTPLIEEIVTTHHLKYYGSEGATPASDCDSPIPNAQIAVRGRFLFVVEGPLRWADLATRMLESALCERGIGAKTRSGHGLFAPMPPPRCAWVDATLGQLVRSNKSEEDEQLRSRALAQAWETIADPALKAEALDDIRRRWQEKGWWDAPPSGKSARQAREIYARG